MNCREIGDSGAVLCFRDALFQGLGPTGDLLLPSPWPQLSTEALDAILSLPSQERLHRLTCLIFEDEFGTQATGGIARDAFNFPLPVVQIEEGVFVLELFHGPTLAFKDMGARFLARSMEVARGQGFCGEKVTILTATSGDTGAAVANAFHGVAGMNVVVLFPEGRISRRQELQLTTLAGNVTACSVRGTFDDCQNLVREAFSDLDLRRKVGLTTANSMNLGRLLPQSLYYFEGVAGLLSAGEDLDSLNAVICVPSGNFGNLTSGLLAHRMGLPVNRFVAATNVNDTVPRYLLNGKYDPRPTIATHSNAMDVSAPNNWTRVESLFDGNREKIREIVSGASVTDEEVLATIRDVFDRLGYILDPHTAVGYAALKRTQRSGEVGLVLATAHPGKFPEAMKRALGEEPPVPPQLARLEGLPEHRVSLSSSLDALRELLLS